MIQVPTKLKTVVLSTTIVFALVSNVPFVYASNQENAGKVETSVSTDKTIKVRDGKERKGQWIQIDDGKNLKRLPKEELHSQKDIQALATKLNVDVKGLSDKEARQKVKEAFQEEKRAQKEKQVVRLKEQATKLGIDTTGLTPKELKQKVREANKSNRLERVNQNKDLKIEKRDDKKATMENGKKETFASAHKDKKGQHVYSKEKHVKTTDEQK